MKVAFINQKGGGCKSTSLLILATVIARAGKTVGVLDYDAVQKSATDGVKHCPKGVTMYQGDEERPPDLIFIDTPGTLLDPVVKKAILMADKIILPTPTGSMDLKSAAMAAKYIDSVRPDVPKAVLFCRIIKNRELSSPARQNEFKKTIGWRRLKEVIPERECYRRILEANVTIPSEDKAALSSIAVEIIRLK